MAGPLKLEVIMSMVDKALAPLRGIDRQAKATSEGLRATRKELRGLEQQQEQITGFRKQQTAVRDLANRLAVLRSNLASTSATYGAASPQAAKLAAEVAKQNKEFEAQRQKLVALRGALNTSGVTNLSAAEATMGQRVARTTEAITRQTAALKAQGDQQRRLAAIHEQQSKSAMRSAATIGAGFGGLTAGRMTGGVFVEFMKGGVDFDATMSKVQALTRLQKDSPQLAMLRQQAKDLGDSTMFSATEAAQGQAFLAMAGFKPESIKAAMPGMLDMAKAGDMEIGRTADISSNILSAFGIDPAKMGTVADILTKTLTTSNVDLEMLGNTMSYVGPVARAAGVDLETTAAMAGLLGNVGIQGDKAGTAMRAMLLRLSAPTKGAAKQLKALGVSTKDAHGNIKPIVPLLAQIAAKTEKLGSADRMAALKDIFGEEPAAAMTEIVSQAGSKGIMEYLKVVSDNQNAAATTAKTMADNMRGSLDELFSAWDTVGINVNETNGSWMRETVDRLTEITRSVGLWAKENPALVKTLTVLAVVLAGAMVAFGVLAITLGLIVGKVMLVRFALQALGVQGGVLALALRGLGGGLRALGVAAVAGGGGAASGLARLGMLLQALPAMAMASGRSVVASFGTARTAIVGATARLWAYVAAQKAAALAGARRGLGAAGAALAIRGPAGLARDAAAGVAGKAGSAARGGVAALAGGLGRVWALLQLVGRAALFNPLGLALTVLAGAAVLVVKYWEPIKAFFAGLWAGFTQGLAPLAPLLSGAFGTLGALLAPLRPVWDALVGALSAAWTWCSKLLAPIDATAQSLQGATAAGQGFGAWLAGIVVAMAQMAATFFTFGANIVQGLIGGIQSMLGAVRDAIGSLGSSVIGWFKEKLGIHSPSRVFRAAGVNVGEGAALGIGDTQAMVRRAAAGMAAAATVALPGPTLAMPPQLPELVQQVAVAAPPALPPLLQLVATAMPPTLAPLVQRVEAATPPQLPELVQRVALAVPPADLGEHVGGPELAAVQTLAPIDRRPPMSAAPARAAPPAAGPSNDRFEFHIHAAPGMDVQMLAAQVRAQVRAELDQRDADKRSRAERSFLDLNHS